MLEEFIGSDERTGIFLRAPCLSIERFDSPRRSGHLPQSACVPLLHRPGDQSKLNLHREFHASCGSLPINFSAIFTAYTVDGDRCLQLHSYFQVKRNISGYSIVRHEGSQALTISTRTTYQLPYKDVNERLLHLSHLLSIGNTKQASERGDPLENGSTLCDDSQSRNRADTVSPKDHDKGLDVNFCSSCGAVSANDAVSVRAENAGLGRMEPVLRVFRLCGLTKEHKGASLTGIGEFIYSFFCHVSGGTQRLDDACTRSASCLELLCASCHSAHETLLQ